MKSIDAVLGLLDELEYIVYGEENFSKFLTIQFFSDGSGEVLDDDGVGVFTFDNRTDAYNELRLRIGKRELRPKLK